MCQESGERILSARIGKARGGWYPVTGFGFAGWRGRGNDAIPGWPESIFFCLWNHK